MGSLPRLIAHHTDGLTLAVEAAVALLLALLFGGIWLRQRQQRTARERSRGAEMREEEG